MDSLVIESKPPKAEEYLELRKSVGWLSPPNNRIKKALKNSNYTISLRDGSQLIGFGRVVGDGIFTFHIVDIIVLKDYQGRGLGKLIMENIMKFIMDNKEPNSGITLLSAAGKEGFYKKFGFIQRPTDNFGCGMMYDFNN